MGTDSIKQLKSVLLSEHLALDNKFTFEEDTGIGI